MCISNNAKKKLCYKGDGTLQYEAFPGWLRLEGGSNQKTPLC